MGFVALLAIGAAAFVLLLLLGIARAAWTFIGAALMLGAAGYAWQGSPGLASRPTRADTQPIEVDPGMVAFRQSILPGEPDDAATLSIADDHLRSGDAPQAVQTILAAISARPKDAALWTALGSALAAHDGQTLSPPARFAFRRAFQLAPSNPGPAFFLGMTQVQAGEIAAARPAWQHALALTPPDAPYRADIVERLALVDAFLAMSAKQGAR